MARLHSVLVASMCSVLACGPSLPAAPEQEDSSGESSVDVETQTTDDPGETTLGTETDSGDESTTVEPPPDPDLPATVYCEFADPYLEIEVALALGLEPGPVPVDLAATLTEIDTGVSSAEHFPSSLEGIDCLVNLERLELGAGTLVDLTPLAALTELQYLQLVNQDISDLSPLAANTKLDSLYLRINPVPDGALTQIAGLDLRYLSVADTQISSLEEIPLFENLFFLSVSGLPIDDLSLLAGLPLGVVSAKSTQISDLTPLLSLTGDGLESLDIQSTQVTDLSVLLEVNWNFQPFHNTCPVLSVDTELLDAQSVDFVIPTLCNMGVDVNNCLFCPQ
jgi:Leucine-rich repeat (LRR) protein